MTSANLKPVSQQSLPEPKRVPSPHEALPTMYDLPCEFPEEPPLPDEYHDLQAQMLSRTLQLTHYTRQNRYTVSDLNVYYELKRPLWHKRPDWFLAVGVPRLYGGKTLRKSYVTWQEGKSPHVIVEFLSPGTAKNDLGRFYKPVRETRVEQIPGQFDPSSYHENAEALKTVYGPPDKFTVYEEYLQVPHYVTYHQPSQHLRYFKLINNRYQEQVPLDGICQFWLEDLAIGLGIWEGEFEENYEHWLRWCDLDGTWFLTDTERERQAKEQEQLAKEQMQLQLVQAARNLLATGMTIEQVTELLDLSETQQQQLVEADSADFI